MGNIVNVPLNPKKNPNNDDIIQWTHFFQEQHLYESQAELHKKQKTLDLVNQLLKQCATDVMLNLGFTTNMIEAAGFETRPFGSYRLGVDGPGADVDLLCIGSRDLDRAAFMEHVNMVLEQTPNFATDISYIPDAFVPVIKCTIHGLSMDLLYVSLFYKKLEPNVNIFENSILTNLDRKSVASLNGCRVTDTLLKLNHDHIDRFRLVLKFIKFWAKRRGIYSNMFGYLGGISWALLVTITCQTYPGETVPHLLIFFFRDWSAWPWPKPAQCCSVLPEFVPNETQIMPILTPAYPSMNSTFNVNIATFSIIQKELLHAHVQLSTIPSNLIKIENFYTICFPLLFFKNYKHYLQITISAASTPKLHKWLPVFVSVLFCFIFIF
jgi:poly(A) polymerase